MTGVGRVLVIVYGIMALAATGRSFVQIVEKFDEAPLAYTLSAVVRRRLHRRDARAGVRRLPPLVPRRVDRDRVRAGRRARDRHAEPCVPRLFQHPTVWSLFGYGYVFIPLVLPFFGLWWLVKHPPLEDREMTDAAAAAVTS